MVGLFQIQRFRFLFSSNHRMTLKTGFDDWNHLASHLCEHEKTAAHRDSMLSWARLESTDKKGTVDDAHQRMISSNLAYWKDLLVRIFTIVYDISLARILRSVCSVCSGQFEACLTASYRRG